MSEEQVLLLSVDELIHRCIGNDGQNCGYVDFKGIQTILHLLARQMRMLEQKVEIRPGDLEEPDTIHADDKPADKAVESDATSVESVISSGGTRTKIKKSRSKMRPKSGREVKPKASQDVPRLSAKEKKSGSSVVEKPSRESTPKVKVVISREQKYEEADSDIEDNTDSEVDEERTADGGDKTGDSVMSKTTASSKTSKTRKLKVKASKSRALAVKEKKSKDNKVLVVQRKSSASDASSGIEVVTRSQFSLVQAAVRELQALAGPAPAPALPDNQRLREDVTAGRASLSDTMHAMNVTARVDAAEEAIKKLASLMTQVTQATGVPDMYKSSEIHRLFPAEPPTSQAAGVIAPMPVTSRVSAVKAVSAVSAVTSTIPLYVTHEEMEYQFRCTREDLMKALTGAAQRANTTADHSFTTARSISEKMDIAVQLNNRVNHLYSMVSDYAEQLKGFDSGIGIQIQGFQDQMNQMTEDLKGGLDLMENTHSNAENAAIQELTERYEGLVSDLDTTVSGHQALSTMQEQLATELKSLVECVEMLREQKADRDEVQDALRDKADITRMDGLLSEERFAEAQSDLEGRLQVCYDKFSQQEEVWLLALKELGVETTTKADSIQLHTVREEARAGLQALRDLSEQLLELLGEPKAALLLRQICRGAVCGSCAGAALMERGGDVTRGAGLPALVPAAARAPPAPRVPEPTVPHPGHRCQRWVGGSHTLLGRVLRLRAMPHDARTHARKYIGYGDDGMGYHLEEPTYPCVECNPPPSERGVDAAGDKPTAGMPRRLNVEDITLDADAR